MSMVVVGRWQPLIHLVSLPQHANLSRANSTLRVLGRLRLHLQTLNHQADPLHGRRGRARRARETRIPDVALSCWLSATHKSLGAFSFKENSRGSPPLDAVFPKCSVATPARQDNLRTRGTIALMTGPYACFGPTPPDSRRAKPCSMSLCMLASTAKTRIFRR